jgi:hypothetical protein
MAARFGLPAAWARQDSNLDLTDYEIEVGQPTWLCYRTPRTSCCAQLRVPVASSVPASVPTLAVNAAVSLAASSCAGT